MCHPNQLDIMKIGVWKHLDWATRCNCSIICLHFGWQLNFSTFEWNGSCLPILEIVIPVSHADFLLCFHHPNLHILLIADIAVSKYFLNFERFNWIGFGILNWANMKYRFDLTIHIAHAFHLTLINWRQLKSKSLTVDKYSVFYQD